MILSFTGVKLAWIKLGNKWVREEDFPSYSKKMEESKMAEQKAVPLNVVVSDKGQKSKRIGKAFINLDGKVPLSLTISLKALRAALDSKTVTEQEYQANEKYPDQVLDGEKVVRMAGFKVERRSSI